MKKILSKWKRSILVFFLIFCSLLLTTLHVKGKRDIFFLDSIVNSVFSPVQSFFTRSIRSVKQLGTNYLFVINAREENILLKEEIERLRIDRERLLEIENQYNRLLKQLQFQKEISSKMILAEVVGNDFNSWFKTIVINKGTENAIEKGMTAMTADGLVGRTIEAGTNNAKILLLTDFRNAVDAMVQRTRDRGVVIGNNSNILQMRFIPLKADIQIGDVVISSGMGGVYPKGLVVGTVTKIKRKKQSLFQEAEIAPSGDFTKLEEVFIISKK